MGGAPAATVRDSVAVPLKLPDTPVIVIVTVPVVAVLLAANVNVLLVAVGFTLYVSVTPPGSVEVESVTFPLKPFCGVTETVLVPLPP